MAPPIVQDSDDEAEILVSPDKPPHPDTASLSDVTSPAANPSGGSTERLASDLLLAHENLVAPSPDEANLSHGSGSVAAFMQSPTMSKIKRHRTTMDELGSQKRRKSQKTYGSRTTLDDLGLHQSAGTGDWRHDFRDGTAGSENGGDFDMMSLVPCKRKRAVPDEESASQSAKIHPKQTANTLSEMIQSQASPIKPGPDSSVTLSQAVDSALEDLQTLNHKDASPSQHYKQDQHLQKPKESSGFSTQSAIVVQVPYVECNTRSRVLDALEEDELSSGHVQRIEQGEGALDARELRLTAELSDKTDPEATLDEGKLIPRLPKEKKRSKSDRKLPESSQEDELGSDEIKVNLPTENYAPRPSRSRGSALPDDFLAAIDFSKRPESVSKSKSKLKRRKTTSDIVVHRDDEDREDIGDPKLNARDTTLPKVDERKPEEQAPEVQKRKRGRPKKQPVEATLVDENSEQHETVNDTETAESLNPGTGKKRGRKKKVIEQTIVEDESDERKPTVPENDGDETKIKGSCKASKSTKSEIFVDDDDMKDDEHEAEAAEDADPLSNPSDEQSVLKDNPAASNSMVKASTPVAESPKSKTSGSKGPDKHSPLNSNRPSYRVGLSRHARIAPLLRMVRK